ncbi:MAG: hypothetical protein HON90_02555 [Halobacteriovoraceae bacterium]|nr:hypothetical protein [Halobacteriovoraceae bacterium]
MEVLDTAMHRVVAVIFIDYYKPMQLLRTIIAGSTLADFSSKSTIIPAGVCP